MLPPEPEAVQLSRAWVEKADADLRVAGEIVAAAGSDLRIREIVGFHCQQAVEKYLRALLTRCQLEFPRTHDIRVLLELVSRLDPPLSNGLQDTDWLTPFGVSVRYPGDIPEMLPGEELKALELAPRTRRLT